MNKPLTLSELEAYLDEALSPEEMANVERAYTEPLFDAASASVSRWTWGILVQRSIVRTMMGTAGQKHPHKISKKNRKQWKIKTLCEA